MDFDASLVAGKLRRWEKYLNNYHLPEWDEIPNFGLYMEQVITLLQQYLDYLPPELQEEQFITAAAINNYVRKKIMPEPVKKKYYREHVAYLLIICGMKHSLSIPTLQTMLPNDLSSDELKLTYESYVHTQHLMAQFFIKNMRELGAELLEHKNPTSYASKSTADLIYSAAILSGFSRLTAEKLLLLEGKTDVQPEPENKENEKKS